jgi:anti-sigma B factor antagonist
MSPYIDDNQTIRMTRCFGLRFEPPRANDSRPANVQWIHPPEIYFERQGMAAMIIQLHGRLDVQGGAVLQQRIADIAPIGNPLWVLDMGNVDFIDSAGLVALIEAFQTAAQAGSRLVLCSVRPPARLILDITQLDQVFTIFNSYEEFLLTLSKSVELREPALV